uniref:C-type lectin domain-containing protein n=1 Tax=Monopterus albus TaxID=43700 RepID=A0A3Q3Q2C2_MONAL
VSYIAQAFLAGICLYLGVNNHLRLLWTNQSLCHILAVSSAHCQCQPGWREYQNKCYFFSTDVKSWLEANELCLEQHSNLMSIQDIQERMWVRTQIGQEIFWIGLNDRVVEGVWEWTDGSPFIETLSYWMPGQPDNWGSDPGEDCGQVVGYSSGHWNDETCSLCRQLLLDGQ